MTLMKLEFSGQILEKKHTDIKFHENLCDGGPSCSMRSDRRSHRAATRNFAKAPKNLTPRKINLWISDKFHAKICSASSE